MSSSRGLPEEENKLSVGQINRAFGSTLTMMSANSMDEKNGVSGGGGVGLPGGPNSSSAALAPDDSNSSNSDNTGVRKRFNAKQATMDYARDFSRRAFTKKQLYRKIPILDWAPKYDTDKLVSDMIAGVTVGLTVIPQGIAYAIVAGLPPQYGLYSAFMGCFVYCIFGSSKDITVGPTAIMSLMTAEKAHLNPDFAVLLAFISGILIFLFGALRLGFVIDFISIPVIAGFTSAAAITIASGQVKSLFGLSIDVENHITGVTGDWVEVFQNFSTIRYQDTILGITCCVILLLMRKMKTNTWFDVVDADESGDSSARSATCCQSFWGRRSPVLRKVADKTIWVVSTARNAIVVFVCLGIAYAFDPHVEWGNEDYETTFVLTGNISAGLPDFELPPFSTVYEGQSYDFLGMIKELGSACIVIPLVAILENVAIAKAFSAGKPIDANQEMIALGLCNFMGSFVSAYPTTGSFSRTAVNASSGVKTTFGGVYTGILVLLTLAVLMPACAYIPKATLAAVIITAVIFSVEHHVVKPMWQASKSDLLVGIISFLVCLFWELEMGILVGALFQIGIVLFNTARPSIKIVSMTAAGPGTEYLYVSIDRAIVFPSVSFVRNVINKASVRQGESRLPVVVDCFHIYTADFTAYKGFQAMASDFKRRNQAVFFINVRPSVEETLTNAGPGDIVIVHSEGEMRERLIDVYSNNAEIGDGIAAATADPLLSAEGAVGAAGDNVSEKA